MLIDLKKLVIQLSNAFGPSGFEAEVREIFRGLVSDHAEVSYDNLGSIIATRRGKANGPKILLAAHMDEVGLMVRGVLPSGYLKTVPLGGWWAPALLAQPVLIRSKKGDRLGVVGAKPPHYMTEEEKGRPLKMSDLYIDVGARNIDEVAALGISPGDPIVPAVCTESLGLPGVIAGKAFDDRIGCAAIVEVMRRLDQNHPNQVFGAGTVQEENGLKGARTVASLVAPDICFILEGAPADDFADAGSIVQGRLGGGPQIRFLDPSMIANQALVKLAVSKAGELGIPFQAAVREGGGTDGKEIQLAAGGVPTVVIGVPVRYAHSHQGIVHLNDLELTVQLIVALIQCLDEVAVNKLKQFPW